VGKGVAVSNLSVEDALHNLSPSRGCHGMKRLTARYAYSTKIMLQTVPETYVNVLFTAVFLLKLLLPD
jgi:hypothetical protein